MKKEKVWAVIVPLIKEYQVKSRGIAVQTWETKVICCISLKVRDWWEGHTYSLMTY